MKIETAPSALRAAVTSIITEQMADELLARGADLADREASIETLRAAGFGTPSITFCTDAAIAEATRRSSDAR